MTQVNVIRADAVATRGLILEMHGAELSEMETKTLDACVGPTAELWIGLVDGRPVCAWGLVPPTVLSERAYLWLYASQAVDEYKFLFVRYSQRIVEALRQDYPVIEGVCDITNSRAIRWLKWLGANFGDPHERHVPFIIGGQNG